jgi:hypothetical protein
MQISFITILRPSLPVMKPALLGEHIESAAYALVKRTPSAIKSSTGVHSCVGLP